METRTKGKAIIGIAMAAVMVVALMAMAPSVSAVSISDNYNHIGNTTTPQTVLIGQNLQFNSTFSSVPTVYRYSAGYLENTYTPDANYRIAKISWPTAGAYYASTDATSDATKKSQAQLSVASPNVPLSLKIGSDVVSSAAQTTYITVATSGINLLPSDVVDLKIIGPDGQVTKANSQNFTNITLSTLQTNFGSATNNANKVNTTGWAIGSYTFQIVTKSKYACGLSAESAVVPLAIVKSGLTLSADKTTCVEGEVVKLTVTGVAGNNITVSADPLSETNVEFPVGLWNNNLTTAGNTFNHNIDSDGTRYYAVQFNTNGAFTVKVVDTTLTKTKTLDFTVTEKGVTFDVPSTVVIGSDLIIKGTANTGAAVTVAVDGKTYTELIDLTLDENGEFSKKIATGTACNSALSVPGSVRLAAFIDQTGTDDTTVPASWGADDGSIAILMTRGKLTGGLSTSTVALGDAFKVIGTSDGTNSVDVVIVAPKGAGGTTIVSAGNKLLSVGGVYYATPSVAGDDTFAKKVTVDAAADTGDYLVIVLSPGGDDKYGTDSVNLTAALTGYSLSAKTQEMVLAIIADATYNKAGSDDLYWTGYIKVKTPAVTLNPIAEVGVGDPLIVTGTSNRKEGFTIVITAKGPMELTPQTVSLTEGVFNATFDTAGATAGTYTIKADDGDGHTDTATVNIVTEVVPTATPEPTAAPTAKPTAEPAPTAAPTAEPTAEPTPEPPGFEAVFAIAGMLSIAYLVLRKRRE